MLVVIMAVLLAVLCQELPEEMTVVAARFMAALLVIKLEFPGTNFIPGK